MKKAKFLVNVYDSGNLKFEAGREYDLTPDTERQIARGNAEKVDVREARKPTAKQLSNARRAVVEAEQALQSAQAAAEKAAGSEAAEAAAVDVAAAQTALEEAQAALAQLESVE